MAEYKAGDSKKEEYRQYLNNAGVLDALTKVLVGLFEDPEKPRDPLEYVKQHIRSMGPLGAGAETIQIEIAELKEKVDQLQAENDELRENIKALEAQKTGNA